MKPQKREHGLRGGQHRKNRMWGMAALIFLFILSGCDALLGLPFQQEAKPMATVTSSTRQPQITEDVLQTPQEATATDAVENKMELVIWVPPFMNPDAGTPEGELFKEHLAGFIDLHPDVIITVRVKARSGQAGLLDSLISTSTAAPLALPSLIMLSRKDLEQAAKRGLILPMGDYSSVINEVDWFQYARMMSSIGDSTFGLPFSANAMVMVYRHDAFEEVLPNRWSVINELAQPVYFDAANPNAAFPIAFYQSLGGTFVDEAGKPALDVEILQRMLTHIDEGNETGVFPSSLFDYQDSAVVWNEYVAGNTNIAITWANHYLSEISADSTLMPLLPLTDYNFTLAEGWLLTLADPLPERRALAVELAEYMVDVRFNADWNYEAGYLPMRSNSLELWENQDLVETLSLVSYSARPFPTLEINEKVAPILVEAVAMVLTQGFSPEEAAVNAAAKLASIEE